MDKKKHRVYTEEFKLEVRGPLGLQIERDLGFEPKTLKELMEWHQQQRQE